jgi:hypothetical protein
VSNTACKTRDRSRPASWYIAICILVASAGCTPPKDSSIGSPSPRPVAVEPSNPVQASTSATPPYTPPQEFSLPPVCNNQELIKAVRIIDNACDQVDCDFRELAQLDRNVDKASLLAALTNRDLSPVHLFFPEGKFALQDAFDWDTTKRAHLDRLRYIDRPEDVVVFVLGRASVTGDPMANRDLSWKRMRGVLTHIKSLLQNRCRHFKGAWFGEEILYLEPEDASLLGLRDHEWRNSQLVLNQAVHVFVFPCRI